MQQIQNISLFNIVCWRFPPFITQPTECHFVSTDGLAVWCISKSDLQHKSSRLSLICHSYLQVLVLTFSHWHKALKGFLWVLLYIYIRLEIILLCTDPCNDIMYGHTMVTTNYCGYNIGSFWPQQCQNETVVLPWRSSMNMTVT